MFGSSGSPKDSDNGFDKINELSKPDPVTGEVRRLSDPKDNTSQSREGTSPPGERKRRGSRAREMLSNAKQSFSTMSSSPELSRSPFASSFSKLGRADPALLVPQGSLNNSAGESVPTSRSTFRVGVTEDRNKKCRRTMEDTHAYLYNFLSTPAPDVGIEIPKPRSRSPPTSPDGQVTETDNGYFAIFDGHAGNFAADWCGKKVHVILEDIIRQNPNTPIPELLDQTFTTVDQQLDKLPLKNSGCTAVVALIRWEDRIPNSQSATGSTAIAPATVAAIKAANESDSSSEEVSQTEAATQSEAKLREAASRQRVLYTANVGDARIVLCRNGKALRLSYDHKGSDENEGKRIASAGGLILNNRVNGVLAVTRALGDAYMKDLVTGHPYTTETVIQPDMDEFLILACDGLWDVCSDQEAVDLVRAVQDPQVASKMLVDHALSRFSTDNLSCMIVRFSGSHDEPIGVDGDATSGSISEADAIVASQKDKLAASGQLLDRVPDDIAEEEETEEKPEPGPELNLKAVEAARKDRKPAADA